MKGIYFCANCERLLDNKVWTCFTRDFREVKHQYQMVVTYDMKGANMEHVRFFLYFGGAACTCGTPFLYVFQTRYDTSYEGPLEPDHFRLVHVEPSVFRGLDGIHLGIKVRTHLALFFDRWNQLAEHLYVFTPFIGAHWVKTDDWKWLIQNVDPWRITVVTRKRSAGRLKKEPIFKGKFNELFEESLSEEDHLKAYEDTISKPIMLEKQVRVYKDFHAKFFAGLFQTHAEVFITSFNLFAGQDRKLESVAVSVLTREEFARRYLAPFRMLSYRGVPDSSTELTDKVGIAASYPLAGDRVCNLKDYTNVKWGVVRDVIDEIRAASKKKIAS
jgi:hypothetical protein